MENNEIVLLLVESLKEIEVFNELEDLRIEYSVRDRLWDITIKLKVKDIVGYGKYNKVVRYLKEKLESKEISYYMELEVESLSDHYKVKTTIGTFEALSKYSHSIVGWERV